MKATDDIDPELLRSARNMFWRRGHSNRDAWRMAREFWARLDLPHG